MISDLVSFYLYSIMLFVSALGIIFAPRMFLSLISFVFFIIFSSLLFFGLKSSYVAVFQLILCGVFLSGYIFLLLKKIGRLNLKNKLVPVFKKFSGALVLALFGTIVFWFFKEDFSNALFDIFNFVYEKSDFVFDFAQKSFPLHLVLLLVFVTAVVIRVFLLSSQNSALSSEGCIIKPELDDEEEK